MQFDVKKHDSTVVVKLKDRKLDASVSSDLKAEFMVLCKPPTKHLIIDLGAVEFCDSSGLSALLIADRKMREIDGGVLLANLHKKVVALMKISQIDRSFQVFDTAAKALKSLQAS